MSEENVVRVEITGVSTDVTVTFDARKSHADPISRGGKELAELAGLAGLAGVGRVQSDTCKADRSAVRTPGPDRGERA